MSRYTNVVYVGRCLILTYIERFFFHNFFLTCSKIEARFTFDCFKYSPCSFQTLRYFFSFCYLVCKLFKGLFQSLDQPINCMNLVFKSCNKHISETSKILTINLYLKPCSIAIYGKFCLYCL